ncbi:Myb-like DNA-binding domain containing protein [Trichomonas vaginalis G3]|uniref:Myb-like DNA-binding domain containing protein n=1 Tax=Trichomonas vaginalis (strain ATCC PRA-98 / G3) TaxID=412133 RepID=A2FLH1_TRIV3|nr:RNA polymerase II transcription regulator recruiting protein [Trichomonas vaginalis G3]EAX94254.1 Myb-like DNA-binding domain containing protein [Trichomonas vaginalis G3]KAI5484188.1 RNA polymerase II transcription regulator recruiting protein [Trichomonas vaginalis G3]|eukprot:XP_001307184.1 Myb-like DNA-binding domain containing protein [Trichomonas vaginalis G3]
MESNTNQNLPEQKKRKVKNAFTEEEDQKLITLVREYGCSDWNTIVHFMPGRTTRQIRERYKLYLAPEIKSDPWTEDEDKLLHELYAKHGPKWATFTPYFNNRTPINIKNRYKQIIRHVVRQNRKGIKAEVTDPLVITHNMCMEKIRGEKLKILIQIHNQIEQTKTQQLQQPEA